MLLDHDQDLLADLSIASCSSFMCDPNQRHFLLLIICATSDSFLPAMYAMLVDSHSATHQLSGSMLPLCDSGLLCGGHCTLSCCEGQGTTMGCTSLLSCSQVCTRIECTLLTGWKLVCQAAPRARPSNSLHSKLGVMGLVR